MDKNTLRRAIELESEMKELDRHIEFLEHVRNNFRQKDGLPKSDEEWKQLIEIMKNESNKYCNGFDDIMFVIIQRRKEMAADLKKQFDEL